MQDKCGAMTELDRVHWSLWYCDPVTGREGQSTRGEERKMRELMERSAKNGEDVWLIDPSGKKHLPE